MDFSFLSEAYLATDRSYQGRVTVPVLWDKQTGRIVNNSDDDLLRILNSEFNLFTKSELDLYPVEHRAAIDRLNELIYENVNDGVYRAGFATAQSAYEQAAYSLFETLDQLDGDVVRSAIPLWGFTARNRLEAIRYADPVRRRLSWSFQMQHPSDRRLLRICPGICAIFIRSKVFPTR